MKEEPELAVRIRSTEIFALSHSRLVVIRRVVADSRVVVIFIVNAVVGRKADLAISDRVIDVLSGDGWSNCNSCNGCCCCRSRASHRGSCISGNSGG